MYFFRISKFDRARPAQHRALDWTSVSDIGQTFGGELLTQEGYEAVEDRYLKAVRLMLLEARVDEMTVTDVGWPSTATASVVSGWTEGATLAVDEVLAICRAQLREELDCHLESAGGFAIDFGFDFYLYVTTPVPSDAAVAQIRSLGLFVEEGIPGPYSIE